MAGTVLVPMRSEIGPARESAARSSIQIRCAANWSDTSGRALGLDQDVAARDVDLVGQREGDGVAGLRPLPARRHRSRSRATRELRPEAATTTASPLLIRPGRHGSGIAAEIEIGPVHPLHRKAERLAPVVALRRRPSRDGRAASGRWYQGVLPEAAMMLSP